MSKLVVAFNRARQRRHEGGKTFVEWGPTEVERVELPSEVAEGFLPIVGSGYPQREFNTFAPDEPRPYYVYGSNKMCAVSSPREDIVGYTVGTKRAMA